jgi:hypothetical protein
VGPSAVPSSKALLTQPEPVVPAVTQPQPVADAAIVVALDGVRWQDALDPSRMPLLADVARTRGARLAPIAASGPHFVSLPGYTEMLTGLAASGCTDNDCARVAVPTIADEIAARGGEAAVFASWDRLERAASAGEDVLVSAGRHGADVDPWPGTGDFRPDRLTARAALAYLEARRPTFLFLDLGEPDEHAHHGDVAAYHASLTACDGAIADLFATLDRMGERGRRTTVLLTSDHGRGKDFKSHGRAFPESSQVWLVAAGAGIMARGDVRARKSRHLADLAPTLRVVLGLPPRAGDEAARPGTPLAELLEEGGA